MIDTNVMWLAFSADTSERALISRQLLNDAESGHRRLLIATLTLVELFKVPEPPEVTLDRLGVLAAVLDSPVFTWVDLDRPTAIQARDLALQHTIRKPYDATVLACAVGARAQILLTWDLDDFNVGRTYSGVLVERPSWRAEQQLNLPLDRSRPTGG